MVSRLGSHIKLQLMLGYTSYTLITITPGLAGKDEDAFGLKDSLTDAGL